MRDAARLSMDPAKMARCFKDDGWRVMTGAAYEVLCASGALPEWYEHRGSEGEGE